MPLAFPNVSTARPRRSNSKFASSTSSRSKAKIIADPKYSRKSFLIRATRRQSQPPRHLFAQTQSKVCDREHTILHKPQRFSHSVRTQRTSDKAHPELSQSWKTLPPPKEQKSPNPGLSHRLPAPAPACSKYPRTTDSTSDFAVEFRRH